MEMKNNDRRIFGRTRLWQFMNPPFLEEVCRKYKYKRADMDLLQKVAADLKICIKDQECFYCLLPKNFGGKERRMSALILLTLGNGPDLLQERYCRSDRLLEAYMVENISSELLQCGYDQVHRLVEQQTGQYVTEMYFYGSTDGFPLEAMPDALKKLETKIVTCTKNCCLKPSKSVLYQARLSDFAKSEGRISLCETCSRRANCENACCFETGKTKEVFPDSYQH